jgi:hypothetical protein
MTCLDCKNCKIKFPINKKNPLQTSFALNPRGINNKTTYLHMVCKKGQWVDLKGNQVLVNYSEQNIQIARLGNSRYLNQNSRCSYFNDMEESDEV